MSILAQVAMLRPDLLSKSARCWRRAVPVALTTLCVAACQPKETGIDGGVREGWAQHLIASIRHSERKEKQGVEQTARQNTSSGREAAARLDRKLGEIERGGGSKGPPRAGTGGSDPASPTGEQELTGLLEHIGDNWMEVRDRAGFKYRFETGPQTSVTFNNRPAHLKDFRQGAEVRTSFLFRGEQRVARDIEILSPFVADGG